MTAITRAGTVGAWVTWHVEDDFPPLCAGTFAITSGDGTRWQTQTIHFAWSTKNFECDFLVATGSFLSAVEGL